MSKREVNLYLADIDDAVSAIRSYTGDDGRTAAR